MLFARRLILLLATFATLTPVLFAAKAASSRPDAIYKGYITINAATGETIFADNADVVSPPASMTKLMTFLIVSDKLQAGAIALDTPVQITAADSGIGGTQVYLDPKETFPVEELIYAMMIQSANDASHALARVAAGSVPAFVDLMNAKARELGMTRTTFRTPHGLPPKGRRLEDSDLTTPRDFAILCRYLIQHTDVLKYSAVRERDFGPLRAKGPQHMINHNKLLGKIAGVDGLKTGYTAGAGYCLSATAERNGRRLIVVIMGSFGPGGQIDKGRSRDLKTIDLIERGFATLPAGPAVASPLSHVPMTSAEKSAAPAADDAPVIRFVIPKK